MAEEESIYLQNGRNLDENSDLTCHHRDVKDVGSTEEAFASQLRVADISKEGNVVFLDESQDDDCVSINNVSNVGRVEPCNVNSGNSNFCCEEEERSSPEKVYLSVDIAVDAQLRSSDTEWSKDLKTKHECRTSHDGTSEEYKYADFQKNNDSISVLLDKEVRENSERNNDLAENNHSVVNIVATELTETSSKREEENNCENSPSSTSPCTVIPQSSSTSDLTNHQCIRAQLENCILSELNDVLNKYGFGIKRKILNCTNEPVALTLDKGNDSEDSANSSSKYVNSLLTLSEFSASLHYELSRNQLNSQKFRDDHYSEVQALEHALTQERLRLEKQESAGLLEITRLKNELEKKCQLLESATKERDEMVVKYAMSEKTVITKRKELELSERRLKEANRARDLLVDRLKTVQAEKEKANNLLETKGQEFSVLNRENQRLKEDLRWTQNKLKAETENKKEVEQRVTDLIRRLEEARLESEQARKEAQNNIKAFQESQENKAVTLDQQLREQHARLILERHERADNEAVLKQLYSEVDALKVKQQALINENNQLSLKVQNLEKERLDGDQRLSRLKQENDKHHQEVADLRERLAVMESLRAQLQHYEDQLSTCRNEMERLRQTNVELQQDAAACREREAELLDFTQKLTEKNVRLQSEFSALEAKAQVLESEQQPLSRKLCETESRLEVLEEELKREQRMRQDESTLLARHLAERTHCLERTQQQLEDCQGEIDVLKRKHAASIRELTREIQLARKRQEVSENTSGGSHHSSSSSTSLAQCSRTSSSSSLNTVCETSQSPSLPSFTFPNGLEPDKQTLIERLVKLQRENAKRAEKLDFMEEHSQVLVGELQKKTRLIQSFIMKIPAGALSSESMDQNKAELAKRTGIMASMYGSKTDEAMTLELSMEINRKLQAVLEDTLLKNITLKENIDTLGEEIARLSSKTTVKQS